VSDIKSGTAGVTTKAFLLFGRSKRNKKDAFKLEKIYKKD
jgi:hypothetical protein